MIRTEICDLLDIQYPVFQGSMAWIADGKLAAAVSGGGGRSIRMVNSPEDLQEVWNQAVSEVESAFNDGSVYLEKYVYPARHVELQVLADEQGHAVWESGIAPCSEEIRSSLKRHPVPA